MPGQYVYPVSTRNVSDSFTDHVLRGSVNPGTDYTAAWGSRVVAVNDGYIAGTVNTFGGSGGRMVYLDLDDGSGVDYLHLSQINVLVGQRVHAGDLVGYSGASGYGSEWYYGAHLHISIRNTRNYHAMNYNNYDFDAFMRGQPAYSGGGATPIEDKDEDMPIYELMQDSKGSGVWFCVDRIQRRHVADATQQEDYRFFIQANNQDGTLKPTDRIESYGAVIDDAANVAAAAASKVWAQTLKSAAIAGNVSGTATDWLLSARVDAGKAAAKP